MSRNRLLRARVFLPGLELLEGRRLPAQFGVPWHHADHLTVSFVPDGTSVAGSPSDLFGTLNAQQQTSAWQREILQAFQTWGVNIDAYFALTTDGGEPLGVPGPDQGDPRFGDIRIAAVPMAPDVLSISVPHDPFLSGTWSGDILLNSSAPSIGRADTLFPVLLHEIGHVLGLDHSPDPSSVMFSHLNHQTVLSPDDIAAVQALYGSSSDDPFEGSQHNDTVATASPVPEPAGYDGTAPLLLYASISSLRDVDYHSLRTPISYEGPLTIRLQTAGVSLLAPRMMVFDGSGQVVGDVSSQGERGDTLEVRLPSVRPGESYIVEVRGARGDLFGIGEYVLAASFDARSTVSPSAIDTLARQSYSYLSPDDIQAIFADPRNSLFHVDVHTNDTFATAEDLAAAVIYGSEAPDRLTASLSDTADVDIYRIETPKYANASSAANKTLVMTVTVRATEVNGIMPAVSVFDANGNLIPALVLAHGDGTETIQISNGQPESDYLIRVNADPTSGKLVGNYDLDIEYGHTSAAPAVFVDATLSGSSQPLSYNLVINEPRFFDFLLAATADTRGAGASVAMVLTDDRGQIVASRTAQVGATAGGDPVFLTPGVYHAGFAILASGFGSSTPIGFRLYGGSLSEPIGPALDNPTLRPLATPTAGGRSAASLPILGSASAPYYWLALGLGNRGTTGPIERQAAGLIPALVQADRAIPVGRSARIEGVAGVVNSGALFPSGRTLARFVVAPRAVSATLAHFDTTDSENRNVSQALPPANVGDVTDKAIPMILGDFPSVPRSLSPLSPSYVVDTHPHPETNRNRRFVQADLSRERENAGTWINPAHLIAALGTAIVVFNRLHSGRAVDRGGSLTRSVRLPVRFRNSWLARSSTPNVERVSTQ